MTAIGNHYPPLGAVEGVQTGRVTSATPTMKKEKFGTLSKLSVLGRQVVQEVIGGARATQSVEGNIVPTFGRGGAARRIPNPYSTKLQSPSSTKPMTTQAPAISVGVETLAIQPYAVAPTLSPNSDGVPDIIPASPTTVSYTSADLSTVDGLSTFSQSPPEFLSPTSTGNAPSGLVFAPMPMAPTITHTSLDNLPLPVRSKPSGRITIGSSTDLDDLPLLCGPFGGPSKFSAPLNFASSPEIRRRHPFRGEPMPEIFALPEESDLAHSLFPDPSTTEAGVHSTSASYGSHTVKFSPGQTTAVSGSSPGVLVVEGLDVLARARDARGRLRSRSNIVGVSRPRPSADTDHSSMRILSDEAACSDRTRRRSGFDSTTTTADDLLSTPSMNRGRSGTAWDRRRRPASPPAPLPPIPPLNTAPADLMNSKRSLAFGFTKRKESISSERSRWSNEPTIPPAPVARPPMPPLVAPRGIPPPDLDRIGLSGLLPPPIRPPPPRPPLPNVPQPSTDAPPASHAPSAGQSSFEVQEALELFMVLARENIKLIEAAQRDLSQRQQEQAVAHVSESEIALRSGFGRQTTPSEYLVLMRQMQLSSQHGSHPHIHPSTQVSSPQAATFGGNVLTSPNRSFPPPSTQPPSKWDRLSRRSSLQTRRHRSGRSTSARSDGNYSDDNGAEFDYRSPLSDRPHSWIGGAPEAEETNQVAVRNGDAPTGESSSRSRSRVGRARSRGSLRSASDPVIANGEPPIPPLPTLIIPQQPGRYPDVIPESVTRKPPLRARTATTATPKGPRAPPPHKAKLSYPR